MEDILSQGSGGQGGWRGRLALITVGVAVLTLTAIRVLPQIIHAPHHPAAQHRITSTVPGSTQYWFSSGVAGANSAGSFVRVGPPDGITGAMLPWNPAVRLPAPRGSRPRHWEPKRRSS